MLRPIKHLNAASKLYPNAWKQVDIFRQSRGVDLPEWPAWCFMPMAAWYAIVSADAGVDRLPMHLIGDVARLAALGTWRYSQGVYQFDPDLAAAMTGTVLHGEMPTDVVLRLPEWCVYIEMPDDYLWDDERLHGFFAHLEWDVNTQRRELRLLLDTERALLPHILHLGPWTVTEAIDRWFKEAERQALQHRISMPDTMLQMQAIEHYGAAINPLLSMLLYLCSDEPDIRDRAYPDAKPSRPTPTRTKKGWRLFPADKTRVWSIGDDIGQQLRQSSPPSADTGRTVKAHLRRGHWHGYWTGPRAGDRKFIYKWIPPLVVSGGNDDADE